MRSLVALDAFGNRGCGLIKEIVAGWFWLEVWI
jgi:hypothetical protein